MSTNDTNSESTTSSDSAELLRAVVAAHGGVRAVYDRYLGSGLLLSHDARRLELALHDLRALAESLRVRSNEHPRLSQVPPLQLVWDNPAPDSERRGLDVAHRCAGHADFEDDDTGYCCDEDDDDWEKPRLEDLEPEVPFNGAQDEDEPFNPSTRDHGPSRDDEPLF